MLVTGGRDVGMTSGRDAVVGVTGGRDAVVTAVVTGGRDAVVTGVVVTSARGAVLTVGMQW